jgi:hypothetical protein
MTESKRNDEIDLFRLLLKGVYIIRKNFWLIVLLVVIGGAVGWAKFLFGHKVFENKMIVSSNILTNTYSQILFDNLNRHMREHNLAEVAKVMGVDEKVAKQINSLKIEGLRKEDKDAGEKDRFLITAEVSDQSIIPQLQTAILYYLENNSFVKVRVEISRKTTEQLLAAVEKEIADMEELKKRIANGEFFQTAKGNLMFDPTSVNSKILELTERKLTYQNALTLSNSVYVIEGFTIFEEQTRPRFLYSVVGGALTGVVIVLIILGIRFIRELLILAEAEFDKR